MCAPYGNLYAVNGADHKIYFLTFCRHLSWFRFALSHKFTWQYDFTSHLPVKTYREQVLAANDMSDFVRDEVDVLKKRCVAKAWTRSRDGKGRDEAFRFLGQLEEALRKMGICKSCGEAVLKHCEASLKKLKRVVEQW